MKNVLLVLLTVFFASSSLCQWNNLISNNSFEVMNYSVWVGLCQTAPQNGNIVDGGRLSTTHCPNGTNEYDAGVEYWDQIANWRIPEQKYPFWNSYVGTPDIYDNNLTDPYYVGYARSGDTWSSTAKEHVVIELDQQLTDGSLYYMEFFTKKDAVGTCLISLYNTFPKHRNAGSQTLEETGGNDPQTILEYESNNLSEWTRKKIFFLADGNRKWLSFGGSGMFDDFKIYKVSGNQCRDEWYFDNTEFNYPLEVYQAGNFIKAGAGVDPEAGQFNGPVTVLPSSRTVFRAGNSILLKPGFSVLSGAEFEGVIEPCTDLCPSSLNLLKNFNCVDSPVKIGSDIYDGTYVNVNWTPSTYLDNSNVGNPTFTPPVNGSGSITYTAHLSSSECALFPTSIPVTVTYVPNSSTNPTISYSNLNYDNYDISFDLSVNDVVSEVVLTYTNLNGISISIPIPRGNVPFLTNNFSLALNSALANVSCCAGVPITISAKSYCNETVSTSFVWPKNNSFGFITTTFPNVITPDGDGVNDVYCFEANACSYMIRVFNSWGGNVYTETGIAESETICTNWHGQHDNGNMLSDGWYPVIINIYNDCGQEEQVLASSVHVIGTSRSSEYTRDMIPNNDGTEVKNNSSTETYLNIVGNQIKINSNINTSQNLLITDNLGKTIFSGQFKTTFEKTLSSGIYYLISFSKDNIQLQEKIIIMN